jgi:DNA-binding cell septation regulator SpoVG
MSLSEKDRATLDSFIDSAIKRIPEAVRHYRNPQVKNNLKITEENDFVLGYVIASAEASFKTFMVAMEQRRPTDQESEDIFQAVESRIPQMRAAIQDSNP